MKVCTKCKEEKDLNKFSPDKKLKCGLQSQCKDCRNSYRRDSYTYCPDKSRKESLKYFFNITPEVYDKLLSDQDGKCLGCKRPQSEFKKSFAVDHDHKCCPGKKTCGECIRGLLCMGCNSSEGHLGDDLGTWFNLMIHQGNSPESLIKYLEDNYLQN